MGVSPHAIVRVWGNTLPSPNYRLAELSESWNHTCVDHYLF